MRKTDAERDAKLKTVHEYFEDIDGDSQKDIIKINAAFDLDFPDVPIGPVYIDFQSTLKATSINHKLSIIPDLNHLKNGIDRYKVNGQLGILPLQLRRQILHAWLFAFRMPQYKQ